MSLCGQNSGANGLYVKNLQAASLEVREEPRVAFFPVQQV